MRRMTSDDWAAEVERERRELERSEWAEMDHRVMDQRGWHRALAARRERILQMEMRLAAARAREESDAELAEAYRGDEA